VSASEAALKASVTLLYAAAPAPPLSALVEMAVPLIVASCAAHAAGLLHSAPICTVRDWLAKSGAQVPTLVVFTARTRSVFALRPVLDGLPEICIGTVVLPSVTFMKAKPTRSMVKAGSSVALATPVVSEKPPPLTLKPKVSVAPARLV
jgi:hypothetical protein